MTKAKDPAEETIRKNLIAFREEAKLSQGALADLAGVPITNLGRYERGENSPPSAVLKSIASVLGRSTDDFHEANPPPLKGEPPAFFLRTRPGLVIDDALFRHLQEEVAKANREMRGKKSRPR